MGMVPVGLVVPMPAVVVVPLGVPQDLGATRLTASPRTATAMASSVGDGLGREDALHRPRDHQGRDHQEEEGARKAA